MADKDSVAPEVEKTQASEAEAAEKAPVPTEVSANASSERVDTPKDEHADVIEDEDEPFADTDDSLTYSNGVIEKIVALATREVPHVLGMKGNLMHFVQEQFGAENLTKGVSVEVTDDNRVVVNISVIIEYGAYAPDIFEQVKERVCERLAAITGLEVAGINLRIEDVVTPEEYAESQKHLIDNIKPDTAAETEGND